MRNGIVRGSITNYLHLFRLMNDKTPETAKAKLKLEMGTSEAH